MATILVPAAIKMAQEIIERLVPDKELAARTQAEMELRLIDAANASNQQQTDINKIEAANSNIFVSGARPFIIWICGVCIGLYYIPTFLIANGLWIWTSIQSGHMTERPEMGIQEVIGLVSLLLGMGSLRSFDKVKGVAR